MTTVLKEFFFGWVSLIYWLYFKPTALYMHMSQIAPGYIERLSKDNRSLSGRVKVNWNEFRSNRSLQIIYLKALLGVVITSLCLHFAIGFPKPIESVAYFYFWKGCLYGIVVFILYGLIFSFAVNTITGLAISIPFSLAFSIVSSGILGSL